MALVTCPDCGREVSAKAPLCPGCGRRLRRERQPVGCCGGCLVLIVTAWLVLQVGTCGLFMGLSEMGQNTTEVSR